MLSSSRRPLQLASRNMSKMHVLGHCGAAPRAGEERKGAVDGNNPLFTLAERSHEHPRAFDRSIQYET